MTRQLLDKLDTRVVFTNVEDVLHIIPSLLEEVPAVASNQEDAVDVFVELLVPKFEFVTQFRSSVFALAHLERLIFDVIIYAKLGNSVRPNVISEKWI